ncbi:MAG: transglutaminase-like domain-containing protein [Proteobacteria bacterium]|nr:transglutaminase-like domain-containing protein [Pseudomonadota bacterium]
MHFTEADIRARLAVIGTQAENVLDIADAALLLANLDLPKNSLAKYRDELDLIASDMRAASRGAATLSDRVTALSDTLYGQHLYQGDVETYDDPHNANLMHVIDRRKGLPVALGILAIHAGRSQGWDISGLNFPGHFLLRLSQSGEHALIDPFDEARRVAGEDLARMFLRLHGQEMPPQADVIQPVSDRDILVRLQNNLKIRALREGDRQRAIEILLSIVLIAPANVEFLAELARLEASVGNIRSALRRLDGFIGRYPDIANATDVLSLKERLSRRLN